jgi:hypothetical protein
MELLCLFIDLLGLFSTINVELMFDWLCRCLALEERHLQECERDILISYCRLLLLLSTIIREVTLILGVNGVSSSFLRFKYSSQFFFF